MWRRDTNRFMKIYLKVLKDCNKTNQINIYRCELAIKANNNKKNKFSLAKNI